MHIIAKYSLAAGTLLTGLAAPAHAQSVLAFNGLVTTSCILSVSTSGSLGVNTSTGTEIGSELSGGAAAVLTVVSTGGRPTLTFSAPTMSQRPAAYAGSPIINLKYSSTGGGNQSYTTGQSSYTSTNALGDLVTLNMKADDSGGFAAGSYRLQTTVTCQQ